MRLIAAPLLSPCQRGPCPALPGLDYGYGVVGSWTPEGAHANMGGRNYQDAESFVRDLKLDKEPSKTAEKPA